MPLVNLSMWLKSTFPGIRYEIKILIMSQALRLSITLKNQTQTRQNPKQIFLTKYRR